MPCTDAVRQTLLAWLDSSEARSARLAIASAGAVPDGAPAWLHHLTTVGRAPADCGVFARGETRKRLYDTGQFTPTIGLVRWPRDRRLHWWPDQPQLTLAEAV